MRPDTFTNTEADAARYEQDRGHDEDFAAGPDPSEYEALGSQPTGTVIRCKARHHNPVPERFGRGGRAPGCYHCPVCGGDVKRFEFDPGFAWCSVSACLWTFGKPSEPPF